MLITLAMLESCGNASISKKVFADKEVEGYWVTSNLLNHGNAQQLGFKDEKGVRNLLRLKNSVNGHSDYTYYVKGESLYMLSNNPRRDSDGVIKREFAAKYQIRFVSKERLVLFDYELQKEPTYYSVMTAPLKSKGFTQLGFSDNIHVTSDSVYYRKSLALCTYGGIPSFSWKERVEPLDKNWKQELEELSKRFSVGSMPLQRNIPDQEQSGSPPIENDFWMQSGLQLGVAPVSGKVNDPALLAMYAEMSAFRDWSYNNPPERRQNHIYPSRQNSWLADSATVEREKRMLSH